MLLWSSSFIALKHVLEVWSFGQVLFMRMGWPRAAGCCATAGSAIFTIDGTGAGWQPDGALEPCLLLLEVNALRYTSAGQAGMVCALLP